MNAIMYSPAAQFIAIGLTLALIVFACTLIQDYVESST